MTHYRTEEETKAHEAAKAKEKEREDRQKKEANKSIWQRKFKALPEEKAVDLFADVTGESFVFGVAILLIVYEYARVSGKPDPNAEKIVDLEAKLAELRRLDNEREEEKKQERQRVETLEQAVHEMQKLTGKKKTGLLGLTG